MGVCSRTQAAAWILESRIERDPEAPVTVGVDRIEVDGAAVGSSAPVYVMLNKPRGIVTSASDEQRRETVYDLLRDAGLPWIGPVGRLDRASEGLLLLSNDTQWANGITDPHSAIAKRYHVQIDRLPDSELLDALVRGIDDRGELMAAKSVVELRRGQRNAWLEIVLDEGRNRQIRRLLAGFDINVLRLVRVAVGNLKLGDLARGGWRHLSEAEVQSLR